jgi:hypothetical protein
MRDVHNAIATTLDDCELVIESFHKPTGVPINKGVCSVVKVFFSWGHKAIKAT